MKEYERTSTTVVNAYLLGQMRSYLNRLEQGLRAAGIVAPVLVMTSNGGMIAASTASEKPVLVVASGPAGGVVGASRLARSRGDKDTIVFDMGGTTAKAVIIENGLPCMTSEYEFRDGISTSSRFIKAGGYMLKVPAIDLAEVGAGGGSLASIDHGGLLRVGPESAGADPGPACYNLGNDRPTVTDANVVLGYISPTALAGGQLPIDKGRAVQSIETHIARPLGISVTDAAHGIRAVANAAMSRRFAPYRSSAAATRAIWYWLRWAAMAASTPSIWPANSVSRRVIVPPMSGVFSAVGMLAADIEHIQLKTILVALDEITTAKLESWIQTDCRMTDPRAAAPSTAILESASNSVWQADLRHDGQATELTVSFEPGPRHAANDAGALRR